MKIKENFRLLFSQPKKFLNSLLTKCGRLIPSDRLFIQLKWKVNMNYPLNLDDPQTFNEKLNWLKLYDRRPVYSIMANKFKVKQFVAERIGLEYVVKNYAAYRQIADIGFDNLPNRFIIKTSHDSGGRLSENLM